MTRTPAQLVAEINGANRGNLAAGINGNLPPGWEAYGVHAMPVPANPPTHVVVLCSANRRGEYGYQPINDLNPSAKATVEAATADLLRIVDELAEQLRASIDAREKAKRQRAGLVSVRVALTEGARMPERKTAGASGYDLCALTGIQIQPGRVAVIETGVTLEMPVGLEAQIRPRSGLASRGIVVTLGTVDSDFRSAVRVMVTNQSTEAYAVQAGDRVAQLVFARVELPELEVADAAQLTTTDRGDGGLGSTGR